jgi:hypothetical protein
MTAKPTIRVSGREGMSMARFVWRNGDKSASSAILEGSSLANFFF